MERKTIMKRNYISPAINTSVICSTNQVLIGSGGRNIISSGLNGSLNYSNAPMDLSGAR